MGRKDGSRRRRAALLLTGDRLLLNTYFSPYLWSPELINLFLHWKLTKCEQYLKDHRGENQKCFVSRSASPVVLNPVLAQTMFTHFCFSVT